MRVLANDGISQSGKEILEKSGIELFDIKVSQEQLAHYINEHQIDVLLVRSQTKVQKELIDECPTLKIIGRGGVGLDNIDVEYAQSKGIKVINTPEASAQSVAELVFAHFFSLARFLHESNRSMPLEGDTQFNVLKRYYAHGIELRGKVLGIIGFGNIGKKVAEIGIALGMKILAFSREKKEEKISLSFFDGQSLYFTIAPTDSLDDVLSQSDFISIHIPKTEQYFIDTPEFEKMKDGVFLANTSRGGIINESALLHFIEEGKVLGAALDVFENEPVPNLSILMNPAISMTPHLGASTIEAQERIGEELANQLIGLKF